MKNKVFDENAKKIVRKWADYFNNELDDSYKLVDLILNDNHGLDTWNQLNNICFTLKGKSVNKFQLEQLLFESTKSFLNTNNFLKEKNFVICKTEDDEVDEIRVTFMDLRCPNCGNKFINHKNKKQVFYIDTTLFDLISEFNKKFISLIFNGSSQKVLSNIKNNINQVVPFVGAGISMPFNLPSWPKLLYEEKDSIPEAITSQEKEKNQRAKFENAYQNGNVYEMLDILKSTPEYKNDERLKSAIQEKIKSYMKKVSFRKRNNLKDIISFPSNLIITSNYDELIENYAHEVLKLEYESYSFHNLRTFQNLDRECVFHIHGSVNSVQDMIVSQKNYNTLYKKNEEKLVAILADKSLIFIGFSMKDEYFLSELIKINKINSSLGDYYLLKLENEKIEEKKELKENIQYIDISSKLSKNDRWLVGIHYAVMLINNEIYLST